MAKKTQVIEEDPQCPDCEGTGLYSGMEPSVFTPYCPTCEGRGTATPEQVEQARAREEQAKAEAEAAAEAAAQAAVEEEEGGEEE